MRRALLAVAVLAFAVSPAFAQSIPNGTITSGQIWTPSQWNSAWQSKMDYGAWSGGSLCGEGLSGTTICSGVALSAPAITGGTANNMAIGGSTAASGRFSSITDTGVTGSTQCLHVNSAGLVSGTGSDCGSGAVGVSSFNTRTGAVTLTSGDVSGASGLLSSNNLSDVASTSTTRSNIGLGTANSPSFTGLTLSGISGSTQCLHVNSSGAVSGTGSDCGAGGGGVTSFNTRTGAVTLGSSDITGAGGALLAGPATFTGQTDIAATYTGTTTYPTNYPVFYHTGAQASGLVGVRTATLLSLYGMPKANYTGSEEIALIDGFGYGGNGSYHIERYDRGTVPASSATTTSSNTLHFATTPEFIIAGAAVSNSTTGLPVGTVASTTSTTVTLTANATNAVSTGDLVNFVGPSNGAVQSGEQIGGLQFSPFDGSGDSTTAGLNTIATETQTSSGHHGTGMFFTYTPNADSNIRRYGIYISPGGLGGVTIGEASYQVAPTDLGQGTLNVASSIATGNHFRSVGTAPTVSSCGTSPTVNGTDNAGSIHVGGATACTITFATTWSSVPVCIVQDYANATPTAYLTAISTTAFTVTLTSSLTGTVFYICQGKA